MENFEDKLCYNNINGMKYEKQGNPEKAIELYKYNVTHRFQGNHPYDRLAIIYRKAKKYDKEIEVLELAIDVFENDVSELRGDRISKLKKFQNRLIRAKFLKEHNDGNGRI